MTQKQNHTIYTQTHTYERCEGIWQPLHILVPGSLTSPLDLGCFSVSQEMKKNSRQASFPSFSTKCRLPPISINWNILHFFFKRSVGSGNVQARQPKTECWLPFGPHKIFLGKNSGMVHGKRTISKARHWKAIHRHVWLWNLISGL